MPKIYVCVDPGSSQTKVIYQLPKHDKPKHFLMPPDIEEIKLASLERYLQKQLAYTNPAPIIDSYLEIENKLFAVGELAKEFYPEDRLGEIKYENALYKVLGILGIILQNNNIKSSKIQLYLAVLLPWNEYQDRQRFKTKISEYLKSFTYRKKEYSVDLAKFICRPEGGGLAALYKSDDADYWQSKRIGMLMFGHRNISALYSDRSKVTGDSPLIGLSQFYDDIIARTSMLTRDRLAQAIFRAIDGRYISSSPYKEGSMGSTLEDRVRNTELPDWGKSSDIADLANVRDPGLKAKEIEQVSSAITIAEDEYWERVSKFLNRVFPDNLDAVIVSGGATKLLQPRLERYFNNRFEVKRIGGREFYVLRDQIVKLDDSKPLTHIIWSDKCVPNLETIFDFSSEDKSQSLPHRLVDAYGLFETLKAKK